MVVSGKTEIELPVPAGVPPQEEEYHVHVAPGVKVPKTSRVVLVPAQMVSEAVFIPVGASGGIH